MTPSGVLKYDLPCRDPKDLPTHATLQGREGKIMGITPRLCGTPAEVLVFFSSDFLPLAFWPGLGKVG